ncbi:MAG: Di-glucose binding within endoplasmic reticulum [Lentisphaerae bacterium ADurb.Bin242]|nr:MAG: Di-glucose binding within endoplasmic reticulum [Lentisphaerae bacterium ADurb.Bin242]
MTHCSLFVLKFMVALLFCAASVTAVRATETDIVFQSNFPQLPPEDVMTKRSTVSAVGDRLLLKAGPGRDKQPMAVIVKVPQPPFELTFQTSQIKEPVEGHYGVIVTGTKSYLRLYTHGEGIHVRTGEVTSKVYNDSLRASHIKLHSGADGDFNQWKLIVNRTGAIVMVDGSTLAATPVEFGEIKNICFNSWETSFLVRNIKIRKLPEIGYGKEETEPIINANFDSDTSLTVKGAKVAPNMQQTCIDGGIEGKALGPAQSRRDLAYEFPAMDMPEGSISFWFCPTSWGESPKKGEHRHEFVRLANAQGKSIINVSADGQGIGAGFVDSGISRRVRRLLRENDWVHVVVTWERGGVARLYYNSMPYLAGMRWRSDLDSVGINNFALKNISKLVLPTTGEAAIDALKIYNRALSSEEVGLEYRKVMPIDMVMFRRTVSKPGDKLPLMLAPANHYMYPKPNTLAAKPQKVKIECVLSEKLSGKVVAKKSDEIVVASPVSFILDGLTLPNGEYLLVCRVNNAFVRSFDIVGHSVPERKKAVAEDYKKGRLIFEKQLRTDDKSILHIGEIADRKVAIGNYLEAGKFIFDKISFEINFGKDFKKGKPYVLEIDWPDDKPRSMGLYMYKKSVQNLNRDQLQGGVQSGNEYPETNRMQTTEYIFYPMTDEYLFEARTMIKDYPAAVAAVRVREIEGGLPRLAVNAPADFPGRVVGHWDEDQTTVTSLPELDEEWRGSTFHTDNILDYLDYTGQNLLAMPVLRYSYTMISVEGVPTTTLYPYSDYSYVADALARRNMKFIGNNNLWSIPEFSPKMNVNENIGRGLIMMDKDGKPALSFWDHIPNIANEEAQKLIIEHLANVVRLLADSPAFDGIDSWGLFAWESLDRGYGEYTLKKFEKETGITVPRDRAYSFLTGEKRADWLKWRADVSTKFILRARKELEKIKPGVKLYINLVMPGPGSDKSDSKNIFYVERGLDIDALQKAGVPLKLTRNQTISRHHSWSGKPESDYEDRVYNADNIVNIIGKNFDYATNYLAYFEQRISPLMSEKYKNHFQSADVKPYGRYFLKEPAFCMAIGDVLTYSHGGQPLGSWGRDRETREFASAYRALPRKHFNMAPAVLDPVAVRYLQTPEGTYFYAVNIMAFDCTATLGGIPSSMSYKDLSDGKLLNGDVINLKPFELRSFLITGAKDSVVKCVSTKISPSGRAYYAKRVADVNAALETLKKLGQNVAFEQGLVKEAVKVMDKGAYAEAHRLLFLLPIRESMNKSGSLELLKEETDMAKTGRFALNCGSTEYVRVADGRLFCPDRIYNGKSNKFGALPGSQNAARPSNSKLYGTDIPEVFRSEAWNCPGYKFELPNGKYKVKLYMKVGYPTGFAKGRTVLNCTVQNKTLFAQKDFFAISKDFNQAHVFETDADVTDGTLDIRLYNIDGSAPSARLCNAIEVIPQK